MQANLPSIMKSFSKEDATKRASYWNPERSEHSHIKLAFSLYAPHVYMAFNQACKYCLF